MYIFLIFKTQHGEGGRRARGSKGASGTGEGEARGGQNVAKTFDLLQKKTMIGGLAAEIIRKFGPRRSEKGTFPCKRTHCCPRMHTWHGWLACGLVFRLSVC